jgi:hypothetical protein
MREKRGVSFTDRHCVQGHSAGKENPTASAVRSSMGLPDQAEASSLQRGLCPTSKHLSPCGWQVCNRLINSLPISLIKLLHGLHLSVR